MTHVYKYLENISGFLEEKDLSFPSVNLYPIIMLCYNMTKDYDKSHDINHHICVFKNAIEIFIKYPFNILSLNDNWYMLEIITFAALLHDTIDHKYTNNLEEKQIVLEKFLKNNLDKKICEHVYWIINNISYSKEKKFGYPTHENGLVQIARNIVSDADKLEAIGEIGILRCLEFTKKFNLDLSEDGIQILVIQHYHDKLSTLDQYIRTEPGKEMSKPKMEVMSTHMEKLTR